MDNLNGKRVIIWGCGNIGKRIFSSLYDRYNVDVVAYTDSKAENYQRGIYGIPVIEPFELSKIEYDYILIAVYSFSVIRSIQETLDSIGVPENRIIILTLESDFFDLLMDQRLYWIRDFSRWCYMQKLEGNVAECGVFRGDTAKYMNGFFPDKKLYLFDTFEGFSESDIEYEMGLDEQEYINGRYTNKNMFADTDMDWLMRKMKNPDNIQICKGYFPETAQGIEDRYCFVNLDMDLYQPILAGLKFFWNKMEKGGCILIHDYFHPELPGVKKALDDFEKDMNVVLNKVTIGDGCSIAIII